jgi:pimeloyl-ACP methyl ester carboxylesterase
MNLQRRKTSPECAARYLETTGNLDVTELLGKVTTPTLVMHARGDAKVPFEAGRSMAAGIPGARFIPLHGRNHLFLEHEATSERFFEEIEFFLKRWVARGMQPRTQSGIADHRQRMTGDRP